MNTLLEGIMGRFSQVETKSTFIESIIERSNVLGELQISD